MIRYRLTFKPDDNGTLLVTSPDLPIVTFGEDEAEALRHAESAMMAVIGSMVDNKEAVPVPLFDDGESIGVPMIIPSLRTELKVHLHNALLEAGLTRAGLQKRLGWQRESVDRLFRLDHASQLDQLEKAFDALSKRVSVAVRDTRQAEIAA